ncbi:hypothetical protein QFC20_006018 [Naganishia adeliensis]|uniref:Uncharacterized protein n=1 Tax=Naganishia adeliensis TaxID=92952 RepID=A0ACC2VGN2_9TREE|nr:hypothetical protein QFC20_006018 [Naganishia adeliensis]
MAQEEEHTHRDVEMMYVQEFIYPPNGREVERAKRQRVEQLGLADMESTLPRCVGLRSRVFYQGNKHMDDIEEAEEEDLPFFVIENNAGEPQDFLPRDFLHFVGTDPNSSSVINFLFSKRGFGLDPEPETVEACSSKSTGEPVPDPEQQGWYQHAYMIIIIGASGRIPLQVWDPLWNKNTELEDGTLKVLNYDRIANVDTEEHEEYLRTDEIRATILETLRQHFPEDDQEWLTEENGPRRWLRITSYNDDGSAIALCRAGAAFMQRPFYFCGNIKSKGREGGMLGGEEIRNPGAKLNRL